jgi:hypothetical protein
VLLKLATQAAAEDISESEIIRKGLERYLKSARRKQGTRNAAPGGGKKPPETSR